MADKAPKFLIGGINKYNNFLGLGVTKSSIYSGVEAVIKAIPLILLFKLGSKFL